MFLALLLAALGGAACGACPTVQGALDEAQRMTLAKAGSGTFLDARSPEHMRLHVPSDVLVARAREVVEQMLVGDRRRRVTLEPDARGVRGLLTLDVHPTLEGIHLVAREGDDALTVVRARVRLETRTHLRRAEREALVEERVEVAVDLPLAIQSWEEASRVAVVLSPSRGTVTGIEVTPTAGFEDATGARARALEAVARQWFSEADSSEVLLEVDAGGLLGPGIRVTVVSHAIEDVPGHGAHAVVGLLTSLFPGSASERSERALPQIDAPARAWLVLDEATFAAALHHRLHPGGAVETYTPDGAAAADGRVRVLVESVRIEPERVIVALRLFRVGARRCGTALIELGFPILSEGARPTLGSPSLREIEAMGRPVTSTPGAWAQGALAARVQDLFSSLVDGDRVRVMGGSLPRGGAGHGGRVDARIEGGLLHIRWPAD